MEPVQPVAPGSQAAPQPAPNAAEAHMLKIATTSRPHLVAGAIAGVIRQGNQALLQAIGAGAVNQAIKSIVIARRYLSTDGIDVVCTPAFHDVVVSDQERTAICLYVRAREHPLQQPGSE